MPFGMKRARTNKKQLVNWIRLNGSEAQTVAKAADNDVGQVGRRSFEGELVALA